MSYQLVRNLPPGMYAIGCPRKFFSPRTWEEFDHHARLGRPLESMGTRKIAVFHVGTYGVCTFEVSEASSDPKEFDGEIMSGQIGAIPIELIEIDGTRGGGCVMYEFKHHFDADYRRPTVCFKNAFGEEVRVNIR
jgi:hypothetical protein